MDVIFQHKNGHRCDAILRFFAPSLVGLLVRYVKCLNNTKATQLFSCTVGVTETAKAQKPLYALKCLYREQGDWEIEDLLHKWSGLVRRYTSLYLK